MSDYRTHTGKIAKIVVLSDTEECKFEDPTGITAADRAEDYCRAFHCNADGDLYVIPVGNFSPVKLTVSAGQPCFYSIKNFMNTNTSEALKAEGAIVAWR